MLIGLDPLLSGELLKHLREMGHGDSLCIADANFPSFHQGAPAVRIDTDIVTAGRAILSVFPLDGFLETPLARMEVIGKPDEVTPAQQGFATMVEEVAGPGWRMGSHERFAFYEAAKRCVLVVPTQDKRPYACIILTKGVLKEDGSVWRP